MSKYFNTDKKDISEANTDEIEKLYNQGYVVTRLPEMHQTRSLRIDLSKFTLTSENRRVLKKTSDIDMFVFDLPLHSNTTNWRIHALGKKFYQKKFNDVDFSASKIREIINGKAKHNLLFTHYQSNTLPNNSTSGTIDHTKTLGYTICYKTENILHYSFPFYELTSNIPNLGMGMMLKAISWAKYKNLEYLYLGSFTRPKDRYKLQFRGLEWWDQDHWSEDLANLKTTI